MAWEEDPIVEEVRKTREKLLDEYGGIEKLLEYIKKKRTGRCGAIMCKRTAGYRVWEYTGRNIESADPVLRTVTSFFRSTLAYSP